MGVGGLLNDFEGFADDGVLLVEDGEILAHVPEVAGDEGLELEAEVGQGALEFGVVLGLNLLLPAFGEDVVDERLRHLELLLEEGEVGVALL